MKVSSRLRSKVLAKVAGLMLLAAGSVAPGIASAVPTDKTSRFQPAVAVFNGRLYLAYTGLDGRLNVASSSDGITFGPSIIIPNNTSAVGPGLAAFNGELYLAWAATDGRRTINYMRSPDGIAWAGKQLYGSEGSYGNPVLAGSSNQLIIAWNGTDNAHNLNVGCIVCTGLPYGTKSTYSPGSDYGVGIAAINDNFFISIRRNVTPQTATVLSAPASNPLTFTEQGSVGTSVRGPGIAGSGGFAYVGWVGASNLLNVATFQVSGTTAGLVSQSQIGMETSNTNPALAILNGHLYYAWLGTDTRINIVQLF